MAPAIKKYGITVSIGLLAFIILVAIFAGQVAPHDPENGKLDDRLFGPCAEYPLGTDQMGRCILSRIIFGARISLSVGIIVVSASVTVGTAIGLISGYFGGLIDEAIMRIVDSFLAFPSTLLALGIAGLFGAGFINMVIALIIVDWTPYARLIRATVIDLRGMEFIKASIGLGMGDLFVILRHVLPNTLSPLLVMATTGLGYVILAAAGLSFLGFGVQPPTPEWGFMLNDGKMFIRTAPYIMIFPGMMIMIVVLAFNYLGDSLRDLLDPRMKMVIR
ncbi:MAG: nickel transporter permease NikC [Methanocella sp. PtaU1.Bin125]|nr:MAG: nickel transporter permease NikC [Methanocella sp. PtaU1.Bin125]